MKSSKPRWIDRHLNAIAILMLLAVSTFLGVFVLPAFAYTVPNTNSVGWTGVASNTFVLTIANIGDLITLELQISDGSSTNTAVSVLTVTDSQTNVYAQAIKTQISIPPTCLAGNCFDNEIWYATSKATGADTITMTLSQATVVVNAEAQDVAGITIFLKSTATGNLLTGLGSMSYSTSTSVPFNSGDYAVSSVFTNCAAVGTLTAGMGYILQGNISPFNGAAEYGNPGSPPPSPTNFPYTCSVTTRFIDNGAIFGASNIQFDFNITNMDLTNYLVVPYNKFYMFNATVKDVLGSNINVMKWKWSDGASTAEVQYSNVTKLATVLQGNNIITIGTPTATSSKVTGVVKLNVIIPVRLSENALDTVGVSVSMYALAADGSSRGYVVVKPAYFNIFNKGGTTNFTISGLCAPSPIASGYFSALCQDPGWMMTNTTWFQLQSYHTEFAINLNDATGNPDVFLFQDFGRSNGGMEHYTAHKNWKIDVGWFYFNNGAWMKAFHVVLSMLKGDQGVNDQWTQVNAEFYNGKNTLVSNQTFNAWIEQSPRSQIRLYVDLWISKLNASSLHAMRVGAYYYAIHQSGFTFFASWSPFLQNASSSMAFAKNIDKNGVNIDAQQISFSKLYWNISRTTHPVGQSNFQLFTRDYNLEQFKTTKAQMEGVDTPIFVDAKIPTLPVDGFLAPLYAIIASIGDLIWGALAAAFSAIWATIGSRFPWFTGFWDTVGANVVNFANLFIVVMGQLGGFLSFLFSIVSFITYPIQIVVNAWGVLGNAYNGVFLANNGPQIIGFFIILIFGLSILEASVTGDWPFIVNLTRQTWRIMDAIMRWTYWFARVLIDAILAIIP